MYPDRNQIWSRAVAASVRSFCFLFVWLHRVFPGPVEPEPENSERERERERKNTHQQYNR